MDEHIKKLSIKIRNKENELNAPCARVRRSEEEIATLNDKKLISKKLETAEMSLTGVLEVIFEVDEEKDTKN